MLEQIAQILSHKYTILSIAFIITLYVCYSMISSGIKVMRLHKFPYKGGGSK